CGRARADPVPASCRRASSPRSLHPGAGQDRESEEGGKNRGRTASVSFASSGEMR
ncbi:hypothetical protein P7K49_023834, partial [Saguinus oedipus]